MPEEDQITDDVREAIMDDYDTEPSDDGSESERLMPKANNCEGPFHGHVKGLLDDEDGKSLHYLASYHIASADFCLEDCDGKDSHLFMVAFFLLMSIACAGNFFIGVYATLHHWSRTDVGLHLMVGNSMYVCAVMWLCKKFSG